MAYDMQFGGVGIAAATACNNSLFLEVATQGFTGGAQKAITDSASGNCTSVLYTDSVRIDHTTGSTLGIAFTSGGNGVGGASVACNGGSNDNCFFHTVGAAPQPTVFPTGTPTACSPPTPQPGDRTTPAQNCTPTVNNSNICNPNAQAWWVSAYQGTQPGFVNTNDNLFSWLLSDTAENYFPHSTKLLAVQEINGGMGGAGAQAQFQACWEARHNSFVHGGPGDPFGGAQFNVMTNSLQYGQTGKPGGAAGAGDISCDVVNCLDQFINTTNVLMGMCEFCPQNGTNGTGAGLVMFPTFVPYSVNVASQADALGRGVMFRAAPECINKCDGTAGSVFPVDGPVHDRMMFFAQWFLAYDTGPNAPSGVPVLKFVCTCPSNGESINAAMMEDFNNHSGTVGIDNTSSIASFDEEYIVPIGDPNVQAQAYVKSNNGTANGWGSCNTSGTDDTHGLDDYLIPGSCDSTGSKRLGVYKKCYEHFSYHGAPFGAICGFLNLRQTAGAYTIASGDVTGYSVTHTYAPMSTCTDSPNCGDYVTGGLASSQCPGGNGYGGSNGCAGSITVVGNPVGMSVPANGGVVIATP
jgi:hypothetical protein